MSSVAADDDDDEPSSALVLAYDDELSAEPMGMGEAAAAAAAVAATEKARLEAEAAARAKAEAEEEEHARLEAEAKAKAEAEEKASLEAEAAAVAAAEKARLDAEEKARLEAEAVEVARLEAEAAAAAVAAEKARLEVEEKARLEAEAVAAAAAEKARLEAAEKARLEAEAEAKADGEEEACLEARRRREVALRAALRQLKANTEESKPAVPAFLLAARAALQPVELHRRPELARRALRWATRRHLRCWSLRARALAATDAALGASCRSLWLSRLSRGWLRWTSRRDRSAAERAQRALQWAVGKRMRCWSLRARESAATDAALSAGCRSFWLCRLSRGWLTWVSSRRDKSAAELGERALRWATGKRMRCWALRARALAAAEAALEAVDAVLDAARCYFWLDRLSRAWSRWLVLHRRTGRSAAELGGRALRWATVRHVERWALRAQASAATEAALEAGRRSFRLGWLSRGWRDWLASLSERRESTRLARLGRSQDHRRAQQAMTRWRSCTSSGAAICESKRRAVWLVAHRRMGSALTRWLTGTAANSTVLAMLDAAADTHARHACARALCTWCDSLPTERVKSRVVPPGLQQGLRRWTLYTAAMTISHSGRAARHVLAMRSALRRMASQRARGRRHRRRRTCPPLPRAGE